MRELQNRELVAIAGGDGWSTARKKWRKEVEKPVEDAFKRAFNLVPAASTQAPEPAPTPAAASAPTSGSFCPKGYTYSPNFIAGTYECVTN